MTKQYETVTVTFEVGKDFKEVVDALVGIVQGAKNDGLAGATAALPALIPAIQGYENILPSVKGEHMDESAGYLTREVVDVLHTPVKTEEA